ncbi:MAG TPA: NmrA/HSCARG family protein [Anaeromyxobacter sp.]|nr:NmrA/HSCARG family protein [Anaeromyxobacter sp.]
MRQRTYFVAGATGRQGGALARQLLARGQRVRAYTRSPGGPVARQLERLGAEICPGGIEEPVPLERAMRGCDGAFAMATFTEGGVDAEIRCGRALIDAARRARVPHLVYSSMAGADRETGVPHIDSKGEVERYLGRAGVPSTIVAPVFFMENWLAILPGAVVRGALGYPLPPGRVLQMVAVEDLAAFVRTVLERPAEFVHRRLEIAGEELPMTGVAAALGAAVRRRLDYLPIPLHAVWARSEQLGRLCAWLDSAGPRVDVARLRARHREVAWTSLELWARRQDWSGLAPPAPAASASPRRVVPAAAAEGASGGWMLRPS